MPELYIVGIGPGGKQHMSSRACEIIEGADIVVGYATYVKLLEEDFSLKKVCSFGMRKEIDRCREALQLAEQGNIVAVVSSGDAGVYGMAGIMLEVIEQVNSTVEVEVVPGITAGSAAAALLGAPLMHDYMVISLSDLLTDWNLIKTRIDAAGRGDFVVCIYNPKSKTRVTQIEKARDILLQYKHKNTPVGIVRNAMRKEQQVTITDLEHMPEHTIDMTTIVIIGNSQSYVSDGRIITPRGYQL